MIHGVSATPPVTWRWCVHGGQHGKGESRRLRDTEQAADRGALGVHWWASPPGSRGRSFGQPVPQFPHLHMGTRAASP